MEQVLTFIAGEVAPSYVRKFAEERYGKEEITEEYSINDDGYLVNVGGNCGLDVLQMLDLTTKVYDKITGDEVINYDNDGDYCLDNEEWLWVSEDHLHIQYKKYPNIMVHLIFLSV